MIREVVCCLVAAVCTATNAPIQLQGVTLRGLGDTPLPTMRYRFSSFATSVPRDAADFCIKYFGGRRVQKKDFLTHKNVSSGAVVVGVRFFYEAEKEFHDVYFIHDDSKPSKGMTPTEYLDKLHSTHHFNIEETWDWYQDWHLCFRIQNVDLVAYRLVRDGVAVVTRSSYSFYVEVPFGITFQFLGSEMNLLWSETFNFCRYTDGTGAFQPLQIAEMPDPLPDIPELQPGHHSFFSNLPWDAFNFTLKHTSGVPYNMSDVFKQSHRYADGRCARLLWVEFGGFQIHFVDQFRKFEGDLKTADVEKYLADLHANMTAPDAFFDFRLGFEVDDLSAYSRSLASDSIPFFEDFSQPSIFMQIPGGIIVEILESPADSAVIVV